MKRNVFATVVPLIFSLMVGVNASAQQRNHLTKKVLFVVTSHSKLGNTGKSTGYYLSEVAHPWAVLTEEGYTVDFVSPKGGTPPVDGVKLDDPTNKQFWDSPEGKAKLNRSLKPSQVKAADYKAIYYAGGHGAMWDFPNDKALAKIAASIYERGGVVAAVCHGPAGLVNIKLKNGSYLIKGKRVNGFSNAEEEAIQLTKVVPFSLEDTLKECGALYESSSLWQTHVVSDQRVITGQNPQSATAVGEAIKEALSK